ncbi:uncharacterized protein LOC114575975 [Exaiptasia diaphana]|uniref:Ubiquitin-like protease family profile domain-containing protein n=1 Tax=Exaiptasia diaphana TaxID=2652724 RepID=A0A913YRH1_EXADI|nr:uncharacterized protein LOC114575975 [Exaiptasia diaphana]
MDASSLSTLVKERYMDNFLIDTVITKYLEENKSTICAFLPTEAFDWLLSNDHNFIVNKLKGVLSHFHGFQILLLPLHMQHAHWGLIVIDFQRQQVLFDDGFHLDPGHLVMKNVKKIMQYVGEIFSNIPSFDDVNSFHHFGMPSQPSSPAEGSGSCGVGVILSARDIRNNFQGIRLASTNTPNQYTALQPPNAQNQYAPHVGFVFPGSNGGQWMPSGYNQNPSQPISQPSTSSLSVENQTGDTSKQAPKKKAAGWSEPETLELIEAWGAISNTIYEVYTKAW